MLCYITWYCRKKRWFKGQPSVATFTPWRVLVMWRFAAKHVSTNCLERRPLPPSERAPLAVWNTELLLDVVMAANALGKLWLWASQSWQVEWIRPNHWNRELRAGSMPMNYTYTFNHIHMIHRLSIFRVYMISAPFLLDHPHLPRYTAARCGIHHTGGCHVVAQRRRDVDPRDPGESGECFWGEPKKKWRNLAVHELQGGCWVHGSMFWASGEDPTETTHFILCI